ncbi:MAG: GAF domain-containing protein [Nitrospinae bacterium]|nr:GAF domain-containing protein [Nitrospinota bacterium]
MSSENKELEERIKRLNSIGIALSSQTDLRILLETIVKEARGFTNSDAGSLYRKEEDKLIFEVAQNDTLDRRLGEKKKEAFSPFPIPLTKKSISGYVALTGITLNISDVYHLSGEEEYSFNRDFDDRNNYKTTSMLVIPMKDHEGEIIGVLQLINAIDEMGNIVPYSQDLQDLISSLASQAAVAIRNAKLIGDIKNLFESLVKYSATAIDARSPHTAGHSRRVSELSVKVAKAINEENNGPLSDIKFSLLEIEELRIAGWLHDIGKIGVREWVLEKANKLNDDRMELIRARFMYIKEKIKNELLKREIEGGYDPTDIEEKLNSALKELDDDMEFINIVNKPGFLKDSDLERLKKITGKKYSNSNGGEESYLTEFEYTNLSVRKGNLTEEEYKNIQSHVVHTYNILRNIPFTKNLKNVPLIAASHHEMLNGTGYPNGLKDKQIPMQARIIGMVDVFDALTAADRPYKASVPLDKALQILKLEAKDNRLDERVVNIFVEKKLYEGAV